jgi:hypothetical protein
MKSAIGALTFIGVIYASCAWLSTIGDYEIRFNEADRRRNWAEVSPPTLRFDDSLEYDSEYSGGGAEMAAVDRRPTI